MSQAQTVSGEPAVRASDTERDQAGEVLRVAYAEGRLTRGELDARIGAAYAATTRADLCDLTSDLPGAIPAQQAHRRPVMTDLPASGTSMCPDRCLLLCLLIAFPPAGIVYWILAARRQPPPYPRDASSLADAGAAPPDRRARGIPDDATG
jgi:hypothetical protein